MTSGPPILPIALLAGLILSGCAAPDREAQDFARWDADLIAAGKLRADRAPIDAPYTRADLAENFARIGFGSEFEIVEGQYRSLGADPASPLTRWDVPLRYALLGRAAAGDAASVADFAARLRGKIGLDIAEDAQAPNLLVFFLDDQGMADLGLLFAREPVYAPLRELLALWSADPRWPCAAEFYYRPPGSPGAYGIYFAVVYIRAALSGISRTACIEEEIAQTLGLARDDPRLRPSIFNDDDEFALLTEHDAALLGLLYDPRLRPGMTADQAMPIVRRILSLPEP